MNKNNYNRTPYNYEQNDNYYEPNYSKMSIREELETRYNELQKQKNCYARFNGRNFDLYDGEQLKYSLDAMSRKEGYQCKEYQNIPNAGPIPEGIYYMRQNQRQTIDPLRAIAGLSPFKYGWRGGIPSWGIRRIPLVPDKSTNTYGRGGFFSHGGWTKGSAGCIDTPFQTKEISNFMDECNHDVPVYVKYPQECW